MKAFADFIAEGKVQKRSSGPAEARSLFVQSKERLADLQSLPIEERNAQFRFEDAYEVLREALQSFLALEGYKAYSHEAVFSFAYEKRIMSELDVMKADRYREIRNDINYRGKKVGVDETKEIISFVKKVLPDIENKFLRASGRKE